MILGRLKHFRTNQSGFTLIELMLSLLITALLGMGATISSFQVLNETTRNRDYTAASRNAMNAVFWIGRDAQMAEVISGTAGFPDTSDLSLAWTDWNNTSYNATYSLENGRLTRIFTAGTLTSETLVAEDINAADHKTFCTSDNGSLTLTITSSVGEGSKIIDVTRVRDMTARPRL
jgi:prepilin-type N-terminal cleavage/methylation domain-containing protein